MIRFIKTTVLGGVLFLIPVALLLIIFQHAHRIISKLAGPIIAALPFNRVFGIAMIDLVSLMILLIICFVAGLLALTPLATRFLSSIERTFLTKVPAYDVAKLKLTAPLRFEGAGDLQPVLVRFDDLSQVGFEIERNVGEVVVYLPGAPDPWSGAVAIVAEDRVSSISAKTQDTIIAFKQLGKGTVALLPA